MKQFKLEVSHASTAQLSTIGLDLKIMSNGWARHGPRIMINGHKLQAPSLRIPGTSRKLQAGLDKAWALGYSGIMELSNFLDKYHSRADKMRILKKMLKAAEANKSKTVSVKKARSIIFNHKEGDMKI